MPDAKKQGLRHKRPPSMNGVFAIEKPAGISSDRVMSQLQQIFNTSQVFAHDLEKIKKEKIRTFNNSKANKLSSSTNKQLPKKVLDSIKIKLGHGGALDVSASGVLVVGVGKGTRALEAYINESTNTYKVRLLLGARTNSSDSEGELIGKNEVRHITKERVYETPLKFTGTLVQSSKADGELTLGESKEVIVQRIRLREDEILSKSHPYKLKKPELGPDGKPKLFSQVADTRNTHDGDLHYSNEYHEYMKEKGVNIEYPTPIPIPLDFEQETLGDKYVPPLITLTATVSTGTNIKSLINEIAKSLGTSAYIVQLERLVQGEWILGRNVLKYDTFRRFHQNVWGHILTKILLLGPRHEVLSELRKKNKNFLAMYPKYLGRKFHEDVFKPVEEQIKDVKETKIEDLKKTFLPTGPPVKKHKVNNDHEKDLGKKGKSINIDEE